VNAFLDRLISRKGLYVAFWVIGIATVTTLLIFTANLAKEVPPIPRTVQSASGEVLYTYDDVVEGKVYYQQFDLQNYGTLLGMGAYLGPDFSTDSFHRRALYLYDYYAQEMYGLAAAQLDDIQTAAVKERVKQDFGATTLSEATVTYSHPSAAAYKDNVAYWVDFLVNGQRERGWTGGVIRPDEAAQIAAFFDWSQLVASSKRPGTDRTWSNNWPPEPLVDQAMEWNNQLVSLWQWLALWVGTIVVLFFAYEFLMKRGDEDSLEPPLRITQFFRSQQKLLKYVPVVALFFLLQTVIGGYLTHIQTDPAADFIFSQNLLPFNALRALHINLAIIWVAIGWLVGGLMIAPLVAGEDLKFPWLVDVLWAALLVVGGGGLLGIYLGATGHMREVWFWLGNEGREYLNLGRVWDIGLVVGLVLWFLMVFSVIRKAKGNNLLVGVIIWSAFGVATLYMAGMAPLHKIMPNYTVDDYYRWWVVHLWVELTFELFAAGVLAFLAVALGLVPRKTAERVMLFEMFLIALGGVLGVGHHYWWQGLDQYWVAVGGLFSALEPLPLVILMWEAWKEQRKIVSSGKEFPFRVPFMWLTGAAFLNWLGAGFYGMLINTPAIDYYAHGTYLIMPHSHVAMLGAFGYISLAFIYLTVRGHAMARGLAWEEKLSRWGFWLVTFGVVLYALPYLIIGLRQAQIAHDLGYYAARSRETFAPLMGWMWFRIVPDSTMIIGAALILLDTVKKTFLIRKAA